MRLSFGPEPVIGVQSKPVVACADAENATAKTAKLMLKRRKDSIPQPLARLESSGLASVIVARVMAAEAKAEAEGQPVRRCLGLPRQARRS